MKASYFYRRTLLSFSFFTFLLLTAILIFANYKFDSFYDFIMRESEKKINISNEILEEDVENEIFKNISFFKDKAKEDYEKIDINFVKENKEFKLNEDITRKIEYVEKPRDIDYGNLYIQGENLGISYVKEIKKDDKIYYIEQTDIMDKTFILRNGKGLVSNVQVLRPQAIINKNMINAFENKSSNRWSQNDFKSNSVNSIYLPTYNNKNQLVALINYTIDSDSAKEIKKQLYKESEYFYKSAKGYILLFSIFFYLASIGIIIIFLKNIYDPLDEVFDLIDNLSKGRFGQKILENKQKELIPLTTKMNRLSGNLNFISRLKNDYLLKKSYEFKQVLANVTGLTNELLKRKDLDSEILENLKLINENSNRLFTITKGLNDYYILDSETIKIEESVNLRKIAEEAMEILSKEIRDKNIEVKNMISERIHIKGDSLKLFLLTTSLLDNAIKYSYRNSTVKIEAIILGNVLRVNIVDYGVGIEEEKLWNLRDFLTNNGESESIGLGYILSKKIVDLHKGNIEIRSKENVGTRVSFVMKDAISITNKNKEKLEELRKIIEIETINGKNRILLLCDNYFNGQIIYSFLKDRDINITLVKDKDELRKQLATNKFDILIMDIFENSQKDYDLIRWVRGRYKEKELPIIFINNRKKVEEEFNIFDLGINDIVEKPISKDKLLIKIENQLKIKLSMKVTETLEKERELVESISDIQGEINSTLNSKKILFILIKRIKELFDFDSALVLLKKENKYGIIFQEGNFEKEERNDRLFKSRYLDPITNGNKIVRLNTFKCKKYFGTKIKSGLVIPFKYVDNNNSVLILKSSTEGFFKNLPKEILDKISSNLSNSIKNAELYNELEEKNTHLNSLVQMLQSLDKLTSVVYKENDKYTAIYYILLILISKIKLGYKEAYFFQYDSELKILTCPTYYYNLKNFTEEKENRVSAKEIWSKRIRLRLEKKNILTEAFKENKTYYEKELSTGDGELFGKMLKVTVIPVHYNNEKFGLLVLESERKKRKIDEVEKEALRIISANLGIYLYSKSLEEKKVKESSSKTLNSFAKAIIHELRTPIVGIRGYANLVKDKYKDEQKLISYMNNIINDSERVLDLSSQIVDYAEEKNKNYNYIEENITKVIDEVLAEFKEEIEMENLEVYKPEEDCYLIFDKNRIKKVFRHIVKNTLENIDYSKEENGLRISIDKKRDGTANITFLDNGIGIEEGILTKVLDPLVSSKIQGTGLALPIAKSIIEKHNWKLVVESVQYNYTKITILAK